MRVFSGSLAAETNTFAPMPTGLASFKDRGHYSAGKHPDQMMLFSGPLWAARLRGKDRGWTLLEGMVAGAQPSGTTTRHAYETLRDELLGDLRAALPVDMVILGLREALAARYPAIDASLDEALAFDGGPVILADSADNPGGGAAGDSTFILRRMVERGIGKAAIGPMWDPVAVRIAFDAGVGARLRLRIGGKISPMSGEPIDLDCTVKALEADMVMTGLANTPTYLGACALVEARGIDIVLITLRNQAIDTDVFTQLDCDLAAKKIIVVKSSQHFYASFSKIAALLPQHEAGKIHILAVSGAQRSTLAPQIPTFKEAGMDLVGTGWSIFFAPASMPKDRVERLAALIREVMLDSDTVRKFADAKMTPVASSRAQTEAMLNAYRAQWVPVVQKSGYQP